LGRELLLALLALDLLVGFRADDRDLVACLADAVVGDLELRVLEVVGEHERNLGHRVSPLRRRTLLPYPRPQPPMRLPRSSKRSSFTGPWARRISSCLSASVLSSAWHTTSTLPSATSS